MTRSVVLCRRAFHRDAPQLGYRRDRRSVVDPSKSPCGLFLSPGLQWGKERRHRHTYIAERLPKAGSGATRTPSRNRRNVGISV